MNNQLIVTISRQFGSSGHQIAEILAKELHMPLFDKDDIAQAAKDYGMYTKVMSENGSSLTNSLLFSLAANMYTLGQNGLSFEQQISMAEEETMRNLAKEGPCIFIGRRRCCFFRFSEPRQLLCSRAAGLACAAHYEAVRFDRIQSQVYD